MPSFEPPTEPYSAGGRPLPTGWAQQYNASGQSYYIDTLAINPRATWVDPRTNPALYVAHDPSLGVTVHHHHPLGAPSEKARPLPSVARSVPVSAPPTPKSYPAYPPKSTSPGNAAVLTALGAVVAGSIVYRSTSSSTTA